MIITINGQEQEFGDGMTLTALLDALNLPASGVVVERNRDIVPRDAMSGTVLSDGDKLEIVRLVGGG